MRLEVLINRAEHPHENEQFRRVAKIIEKAFEEYSLEGLLISNPTYVSYGRFRPDALLYYSNTIILIDLKDYAGTLDIPIENDCYANAAWTIRTDNGNVVPVKGGSYINPVMQLKSYSKCLIDILKDAGIYSLWLTPPWYNNQFIYNFNIFSGPIKYNKLPKMPRYYRLMDEDSLAEALDYFASEYKFDPAKAEKLKKLFPGRPLAPSDFVVSHAEPAPLVLQDELPPSDSIPVIENFLGKEEADILILKSFDSHTRDTWARYIQDHARDHGVIQAEILAHSSKVCKTLHERSRLDALNLYTAIYDTAHPKAPSKTKPLETLGDEGNEDQDDAAYAEQKLFPIKTTHDDFEDGTLFILHEGHLVNDQKFSDEDIQFGSGHLLRDFLKFAKAVQGARIVIIGDPFSLSYGDWKKSALSAETIKEAEGEFSIAEYGESVRTDVQNGHEAMRVQLAQGIEKKWFNRLAPTFDGETLEEVPASELELETLVFRYFSQGFQKAPKTIVLLSTKEECRKRNEWIHQRLCDSSAPLGKSDLLILEKSCMATTENGDTLTLRSSTFLTVESIEKEVKEDIKYNNSVESFIFYHIKALILEERESRQCLLWIDGHFLQSDTGTVSDTEKKQYRILQSNRAKKHSFTSSFEYEELRESEDYQQLTPEQKQELELLALNYGLDKESRHKVHTEQKVRSLLARYRRKFVERIKTTDPLLNAARVHFGWAITPHKAMGMMFAEVILNAASYHSQHACEEYFRWLYTAISAGRRVKMASFESISPTSFTEICEVAEKISSKNTKANLRLTAFAIPAKVNDIFGENESFQVKAAVYELIKNASAKGLGFHSFERKSPFQARLTLSRGDRFLCSLDIYNKGQKDNFAISKITPTNGQKLSTEDRNTLEGLIDSLYQKGAECPESQTESSPLALELEATYAQWRKNFASEGLPLKKVASHLYQDVFEAGGITFRSWYSKEGFITKIEVHGADKETMARLIKE